MRDAAADEGSPTPRSSAGAVAKLAAVTVTYNPDLDILRRQLQELPGAALKVWVDNASPAGVVAELQRIAADRTDLLLVLNSANAGLAAALNQGAAAAAAGPVDCQYLLLLDQDTETGTGGAEALLDAFLQLSASHPRLGCVGPKLVDVQTGMEHGFHQISGCRWVRRFAVEDASIPVANLNGSGTLVTRQLFEALHGLDADFFIDHVDTEWSFRVLASGHELLAIPGVAFRHRMGERSIRFWFLGWRLWPFRSPARHAYLFRNTVRLLSRAGVPICWKVWAPVKLLLTAVVHLVFDPARWAQLQAMSRGVRSGLAYPGRGP